jgi:predicted lipid-binding transport protein (Tim44 family)
MLIALFYHSQETTMKTFSMLTAVLALGCTLVFGDAEAASKRFGGGQSTGMQRQSTLPDKAAVAPTQATGAAQSAAAQAAQPKRSWMGPLAGLAAGLGLAALASHFGFGEELASMLMIGLLVMAVLVVVGLIMRRRAAAREPSGGGLQYAAAGANGMPAGGHELSLPAAAGSSAPAAVASHIPADFDLDGFVRNAKVSFIRLQAANDAGNLDDIRAFTTPEMFAEISLNIRERGHAKQETDVVSVEAVVIDVAEEPDRYIVSTRFNGLIREDQGAAEPFDEIWHLVKPRDGRSGWVVAGIQQQTQ